MNLGMQIVRRMSDFMNAYAGIFENAGWIMYGSIVLIVLMLYGSKMMGGKWNPDWHELVWLIVRCAIVLVLLHGYTTPTTLLGGHSFAKVLQNVGLNYASILGTSIGDELNQRLADLWFSWETPWLSAFINWNSLMIHGLLLMVLAAFMAVTMWAGLLGLFALALAIMFGPLFLPTVLLPNFENYFWGWLRAAIQYSFYPVAIWGFLRIYASLMLEMLNQGMPANFDLAGQGAMSLYFIAAMVAGIGVAIKIPSILNSLFTGSAGQSTWWH